MKDYSQGKVYIIEKEGMKYIGSTTKTLEWRFLMHKYHYQNWKNGLNKYATKACDIFEKYGFENCEITLLENVNCNSKKELEKVERQYIENNICVNFTIPGRTRQEYRIENKEICKQKQHDYDMKRKGRKYLCECGNYYDGHKLRHSKTRKHIEFINSMKI